MSATRNVLKVGARNVEIRFRFVQWNPTTEVYDPVDISSAFTGTPPDQGFAEATFERPDGSTQVVQLTNVGITGSTSDGYASYFTPAGFIDQSGEWKAEGAVMLPGTGPGTGFFPSLIVEFPVERFLRGFVPVVTPDPVQIVISGPGGTAIPEPLVVLVP